MGLAEAIESHKSRSADVCAVGLLLSKLSESDSAAFLTAVEKGVPTHSIVLALRQEGYKMSDNTLNTHRQEKCKCPVTAK